MNDSTVAEEMLSSFNLKYKYIYADKGYDTASIVRYIENQGGNAVIPSKCNAVKLYKERHLVENLFLKAKNFKRFAMRYDKSAVSFSAVVYIAFILIWLH